jgi:deoxyribodipyrimidine photo-lyase
MSTSIVWFKNDLRLQDNETLVKAIEVSENIIPVYCFDDAHFAITKFGTKKTGSFRAQFLLESLLDLDNNLRAIGSGLIIVKGKPEEELLKIATTYNVTKIFAKVEVGFEEQQTEKRVSTALATINGSLHTYSTSTLYDASDLPFSINNLPDIFTTFRKQAEKECRVRKTFVRPAEIKSPAIPKLILPTLAELGLEEITMDARAALQFVGGETEANKRMQHYFYETKAISKYKETRNGLIGADYSSKFSAWLANGCISARTIYEALKKYEATDGENESTYWLVFELQWRDYFCFVMQKFGNKLFLKSGIKKNVSITKFNKVAFNKWVNALTKVDFIDANMLELKLTGYMSNRGRQNVASFFCNDFKLDWRYGASYFEEQLIDYDVASNWGNWTYLAGVGNDPRPNRYFNNAKQANYYDAKADYRKLWLESEKNL